MKKSLIYALIDTELLESFNISLEDISTFLEDNQILIAQYRAKGKSKDEIVKAIKLLRKNYSGKLIINDYIELIEFADGIHLGQEDILNIAPNTKEAVEIIRAKVGDKLIGISTHNLKEVKEANRLDIDYIGLGAYRTTSTKIDAKVKGEELLNIAKESIHPVAIIGGVEWEDIFDNSITYKVLGTSLFKRVKIK